MSFTMSGGNRTRVTVLLQGPGNQSCTALISGPSGDPPSRATCTSAATLLIASCGLGPGWIARRSGRDPAGVAMISAIARGTSAGSALRPLPSSVPMPLVNG